MFLFKALFNLACLALTAGISIYAGEMAYNATKSILVEMATSLGLTLLLFQYFFRRVAR